MRLDVTVAFVAAMLAGYAALDLLPQSTWGRAAALAVYLAALYPMDRLMKYSRNRPPWHHWAGVGAGAVAFYFLAQIRVSEGTSIVLNTICAVIVVFLLLFGLLRRRDSEKPKST